MKTIDTNSRRGFCLSIGAALAALAFHSAHGEPSKPALLLAKEFDPGADPHGHLVSEKFDGVRALWDGRQLRFRSGRAVHAPAWFLARLPAQALDGELWLARGRFEALSGIVRKDIPNDDEWRRLKYLVFELPGAPGTFAERAVQIRRLIDAAAWPGLVAVEQQVVADRAALQLRLNEVVRNGGEGLVLHRADAPYVTGRSDALHKLKPLNDGEALVVAHVAGKGKYRGQLGALAVRTPQGGQLLIGTGFSDADRADPPPIGTTVTYTYRGLTRKGVPRFASYLRRHDAL